MGGALPGPVRSGERAAPADPGWTPTTCAINARGGSRTRNALASARLLRPLTLPVCPPGPAMRIVERSSDSADAPTRVRGGSSIALDVIQPGARPPPSRPLTRALLRLCAGDGRAVARHRRLDRQRDAPRRH